MWNSRNLLWSALLASALAAGCGTAKQESPASSGTNPTSANSTASLNKADYPVFPDADAGADPSVPADMGGRGFKGDGWSTNTDFDLIGDPRAVKGGLFREDTTDFPGTFRMQGPEWSSDTNYKIGRMVYESLLMLDPTTTDYIPSLATHWQIAADKQTYRFRINPNAKFSDGTAVTADDVVASWTFYTDKGANDPAQYAMFMKLEKPVAESKYIVRVKAKLPGWKDFMNFATGMLIFPAATLKNVDGKTYLKDWNFKYLPGTGPYIIGASDINKGNSVSLRRRMGFWAEKTRRSIGLNNFDEVKVIIVRDRTLALQMLKKGDLDFFYVNRSKDWARELDFDKIQRGLVQKRKVFNFHPDGFQGFAINTRRETFKDIRVRQALALLFDRAEMTEKLFFNEYLPINSYFPGTPYENSDNPKNLYDPQAALKLLADAGWKTRDAQGRLSKDGKPLEIEILYDSQQSETYLTVFQDACRKIGITLNLRLVTFETAFKLMYGRQFDLTEVKFGGQIFPDPETMFHSRLADVNDTDNITGFKDSRIDDIIDQYGKTLDVKERTVMMRKLDGMMANLYHYVFQWYPPAERIAYWNKFGQPRGILSRTGLYESDLYTGPGVEQLWWVDPVKAQKLNAAMADASIKLDPGETENHYWQEFDKKKGTK